MAMDRMPRTLIAIGLLLAGIGLLWPIVQKSGLGRLPGDFYYARGSFRFYFPLTTSLIASVVLSLLFWLLRK
jgi:hypothetical protein